MAFKEIRYFRYRNLKDSIIDLEAPEIFLIGGNGQGKTNFVESIYLLCYGSSFRTHQTRRLIREGDDTGLVEGSFMGSLYETSRPRKISVKLMIDSRKEIHLDSNKLHHRQELLGLNPCVVFHHGDMELVNGSPARKRWFMDQTISLFDSAYMQALSNYRRILKSRNVSLKEHLTHLLDVYDAQLAEWGWIIQQKRQQVIEDFNVTFQPLFQNLFMDGESDLEIGYRPSWRGADAMEDCLALLQSKRQLDRERELTTQGPHRDAIVYLSKGKDFSLTASTGQIRLLSLALKAAQAGYFQKKTDCSPLLLLDDVLLEVDEQKRTAFLRNLPDYEQAFFAFLPDEKFLHYSKKDTRFYSVRDGKITGWKKPETF